MDVKSWLHALGMERYIDAFLENDIDGEILRALTADDLKDLGVESVGHRRRILNAASDLGCTAQPTIVEATGKPSAAERRQLTVLFCDLVGSTALSSRLDPEDLAALMRTYQERCTNCIDRWGGHVAKYLGDGVLAYFGYPAAHEDDAERAVRAGLDMTAAVGELRSSDNSQLAARVGIATGLVMVGELIGEGIAVEQTVVGETPNLAARLEALAAPGTVAVAPRTRQLLGDLFEFEDLGMHQLKGFNDPIAVAAVSRAKALVSRFEARSGVDMTPLIGRTHEMALLDDLWQRALQGEGQIALVTGEAGLGKSRLLEAMRVEIVDQQHECLRFQCSPFHVDSALHPFIVQLERAAGFDSTDAVEVKLDKLATLLASPQGAECEALPLLADLLGIQLKKSSDASLTPQQKRDRTLEVLLDRFRRLASHQPMLLLIEDLHWVDPTSLDLLNRIVKEFDKLPALAIFTYRPEFQNPWLGQSHVHALFLNRMAKRSSVAIVEHLTRGKGLPDEVLMRVIQNTDGVPLFVEELTKTVLGSGLLVETDDRFVLEGELPSLAIPESLADSLLARLDRLGPAKDLVQIAAAIGREFRYALLSAVAPLSPSNLQGALDQLTAAELISKSGSSLDPIYTFKHALLQDAAYSTLLKSARKELHARISSTIVETFPDIAEEQPELLARHYREAGMGLEAVEQGIRAAVKALARSALIEASAHLNTAIRLVPGVNDDRRRSELEIDVQVMNAKVHALHEGIASPKITAALERARLLADAIGDLKSLIAILDSRTMHDIARADYDQAIETAAHLDDASGRLESRIGQASALKAKGHILHLKGDPVGGGEALEAALNALPDDDQTVISTIEAGVAIQAFLAIDLMCLGELGRAERSIQAMLERAEMLDRRSPGAFVPTLAFSLSNACRVRWFMGDLESVHDHARRLEEICKQERFPHWLGQSMVFLGLSGGHEAGVSPDIDLVREGLDLYCETGARWFMPHLVGCLASALLANGRPEQAHDQIDAALSAAQDSGERWDEPELHRLRGEITLASNPDDTKKAEQAFRLSIALADKQQARFWALRSGASLARLFLAQGNQHGAAQCLHPVYASFEQHFETEDLRAARRLIGQLKSS